jgi:competence protein ComEA
MTRVNVNSASREDLVNVAGLRPEIADAVLDFRRKHRRIADVQALEELPGVGPATIEQLRKALDFGDKGGNGSEQAKATGERAAETARQTTETAAREGRRMFGAAVETEREVVSRSAEGAAELGRLWLDLLGEQTRHNLEVATTFGRAVRWDEVVQAQSEFMRASFERLGELNRRYLALVQGMMETSSAAVDRARKAG